MGCCESLDGGNHSHFLEASDIFFTRSYFFCQFTRIKMFLLAPVSACVLRLKA